MYYLLVELLQCHILPGHFLAGLFKPSVDQFMPVGMGHADLSGMCQPVHIFHLFSNISRRESGLEPVVIERCFSMLAVSCFPSSWICR